MFIRITWQAEVRDPLSLQARFSQMSEQLLSLSERMVVCGVVCVCVVCERSQPYS